MRPLIVFCIGYGLILSGCGGGLESAGDFSPPVPPDAPTDGEERQGTIVVTGVEGLHRVQLSGADEAVFLTGSHVNELMTLGGATVSVVGAPGGPEFEVYQYSIVQVNGERAWVGVVLSYEDGFRLDRAEPLRLTGNEDALRDLVGSKVWVTGQLNQDTLRMVSYGVLRSGGG
ncbi:MAG: hypothetical protein ACR2QM_04735 [Longimicrobiales bacterium]